MVEYFVTYTIVIKFASSLSANISKAILAS